MHPSPIQNHLFIEVEKTLIDEITTESGFKLFLSPEYNFEQNASVTGKVAILPKNYTGKLRIGDNVAFSYQVISNRKFPNTSDNFIASQDSSNSNVRIWNNGKGEKLRMMAHQGAISEFWVGTYFDSKGVFQHGTQGTESEVERWLHNNFKFGNCEDFIYKNLIQIGEKCYWKCREDQVFAKKKGNSVLSIGDRLVCEFIEIPIDHRILELNNIHIPGSFVKARYYDRAKLISGGREMGLEHGDIVSFDERYAEAYELWGKKYCLVKKIRIIGIWGNPPSLN